MLALIALFLEIATLPIRNHHCSLMLLAITAFIVGWISIYLMQKLHKPVLSLFGFLLNAFLILVFMGHHGFISTILFIMAGASVIYMKIVIGKLKHM